MSGLVFKADNASAKKGGLEEEVGQLWKLAHAPRPWNSRN